MTATQTEKMNIIFLFSFGTEKMVETDENVCPVLNEKNKNYFKVCQNAKPWGSGDSSVLKCTCHQVW